MTGWTTPADVTARLRRRWDRGDYLTAAARGEATLPEDPSEWAIPAAAQPEMQDARRALTADAVAAGLAACGVTSGDGSAKMWTN